jgi:hypothetical protein
VSTSRAALAAYLANELRPLAARTHLPDLDSPEGLRYALDRAYARLSLSADVDVPDASDSAARALARYYGLRRVWERLAIMPESSGTAGSDVAANARTAFGNVKQLLDEARADCAAFGVPVDGRGAAAFRFTLDFLEPAGDDAW